jgi:hypothetical protein
MEEFVAAIANHPLFLKPYVHGNTSTLCGQNVEFFLNIKRGGTSSNYRQPAVSKHIQSNARGTQEVNLIWLDLSW